MCIDPLALLDEQGGQEPPLAIARRARPSVPRARRRAFAAARPGPGAVPDAPRPRPRAREELGPGLVDLQEEGHEIALEGNGRRPGIGVAGSAPARAAARAADPGRGRPAAAGPRSRAGWSRRRAGGRPRAPARSPPRHWPPWTGSAPRGRGRWRGPAAVARSSSPSALLEHEGEQRARRVEPRGERGGALGARAGCPGRGRAGGARPGSAGAPAFSKPPVRDDGPAQVLQVHHVVHHLLEPRSRPSGRPRRRRRGRRPRRRSGAAGRAGPAVNAVPSAATVSPKPC